MCILLILHNCCIEFLVEKGDPESPESVIHFIDQKTKHATGFLPACLKHKTMFPSYSLAILAQVRLYFVCSA